MTFENLKLILIRVFNIDYDKYISKIQNIDYDKYIKNTVVWEWSSGICDKICHTHFGWFQTPKASTTAETWAGVETTDRRNCIINAFNRTIPI